VLAILYFTICKEPDVAQKSPKHTAIKKDNRTQYQLNYGRQEQEHDKGTRIVTRGVANGVTQGCDANRIMARSVNAVKKSSKRYT
jgi:hypothetical protein